MNKIKEFFVGIGISFAIMVGGIFVFMAFCTGVASIVLGCHDFLLGGMK